MAQGVALRLRPRRRGRRAPAVEERSGDIDADAPRVLPFVHEREDARVRPRVVVARGEADLGQAGARATLTVASAAAARERRATSSGRASRPRDTSASVSALRRGRRAGDSLGGLDPRARGEPDEPQEVLVGDGDSVLGLEPAELGPVALDLHREDLVPRRHPDARGDSGRL